MRPNFRSLFAVQKYRRRATTGGPSLDGPVICEMCSPDCVMCLAPEVTKRGHVICGAAPSIRMPAFNHFWMRRMGGSPAANFSSMTAKQKRDAAIKTHKKELERDFARRLMEENLKHIERIFPTLQQEKNERMNVSRPIDGSCSNRKRFSPMKNLKRSCDVSIQAATRRPK
jgi:hypothetical protein